MIKNKIIGIIACSLVASYSFAQQQKRPLDIKACTSWNRIDDAKISPTGRFVTYKIVPIEKTYEEICKIPTMLYDSQKKGKSIELGLVEDISYFNDDKQLYYKQTDTAGVTRTYILDLPSGKKRQWKHTESLSPVKGSHHQRL